jgi:hypothetical protein
MRDSIRIVGVATLTPARLSQLIANARLHSCDVGPPPLTIQFAMNRPLDVPLQDFSESIR